MGGGVLPYGPNPRMARILAGTFASSLRVPSPLTSRVHVFIRAAYTHSHGAMRRLPNRDRAESGNGMGAQ